MTLTLKKGAFAPGVLFDKDGNVIASTFPDIRRLAVDAVLTPTPAQLAGDPYPVTVAFQSGFSAAEAGRRFVATNQTIGAVITAANSSVETLPTFLMRQAASTKRLIIRSITLSIVSVGGGTTPISIVTVIDEADRFSAGGATHVPQNTNTDSSVASALTAFLSNPTATAAGAGTRVVNAIAVARSQGTVAVLDSEDGIIIGNTGSLLTYIFTTGAAPTFYFNYEWEEID